TLEKLVDVRDPAFQQITGSLPAGEQRGRVLDLDVSRKDEDRDVRHLVANRLRRAETFSRVTGRHADVDDGQIGLKPADKVEKLLGVPGLTDNVVGGLGEQAGDPL